MFECAPTILVQEDRHCARAVAADDLRATDRLLAYADLHAGAARVSASSAWTWFLGCQERNML